MQELGENHLQLWSAFRRKLAVEDDDISLFLKLVSNGRWRRYELVNDVIFTVVIQCALHCTNTEHGQRLPYNLRTLNSTTPSVLDAKESQCSSFIFQKNNVGYLWANEQTQRWITWTEGSLIWKISLRHISALWLLCLKVLWRKHLTKQTDDYYLSLEVG